jgi:hypothetical protein
VCFRILIDFAKELGMKALLKGWGNIKGRFGEK